MHPRWLINKTPTLSSTDPNDDAEIEQMFVDLMQRRGWHNLPAQALQQMLAYPPDKKWPLIYQDRLVEWQSLQRRRAEVVE